MQNIHEKAKIGKRANIAPFVTIEEDVVIGDDCWIGPNAVILNGTRIGNGVKIHSGAVVGGEPQDLKYAGEYTTLQIGNNVTIREFCTLNRGTTDRETTLIGNDCLFMAYVHVAHDCIIGNNVILANSVNVAGHVAIDEYAILGGLTAVHQFVRIGKHVMIGGGSLVRKDVPPYVRAAREPLCYAGVNSVGLQRRDFSSDAIKQIQGMYRTLYQKSSNVAKGVVEVENSFEDTKERKELLDFIAFSERGLMKGHLNT